MLPKIYRVINSQYEITGKEQSTTNTVNFPDRITAKSYFPLFEKVWNLWKFTNCQLPTANAIIIDIIRNPSDVHNALLTAQIKGDSTISSTFLKDAREDVLLPIILLNEILNVWMRCPLLCSKHIRFFWEYAWEETRKMFAPQMPSRLDSLFVFDNIKDAQTFMTTWYVPNHKIVEVQPIRVNNIQAFDKKIFDKINHETIRYADFLPIAQSYWNQNKSSHPEMEYLFQGDYMLK